MCAVARSCVPDSRRLCCGPLEGQDLGAGKIILFCAGGALALGVVANIINPTHPTGAATAAFVDTAIYHVTMPKFDWRKGGFDDVAFITATLKNNSDKPIKDVALACTFIAKSGTILGYGSGTIFDVIPPGKTKKFPELSVGFIHSQAASANCQVDKADWAT